MTPVQFEALEARLQDADVISVSREGNALLLECQTLDASALGGARYQTLSVLELS